MTHEEHLWIQSIRSMY